MAVPLADPEEVAVTHIRKIKCPSCGARVMVGITGDAYCEMCEKRYRVKEKKTTKRPSIPLRFILGIVIGIIATIISWRVL